MLPSIDYTPCLLFGSWYEGRSEAAGGDSMECSWGRHVQTARDGPAAANASCLL